MADNTVVTGWLKNSQDNLFAPKTLISQVVDADGSLLENKITEKMDALKAESKEYTDGKLEELIGEKSVQEQIDDHNDSNQSHDDIRASIMGLDTELKKKVSKADIVNELSSTTTDKVLSAAAGATLNDIFTEHNNNNNIHVSTVDRQNWVDAHSHSKLAHAPATINAGDGISIIPGGSGNEITIKNDGVRAISISAGDSNGSIKFSTNGGAASEVKVTGLGSAAYEDTTYFATSHNHNDLAKQSAVDEISTKITYITSGSTSVGKANALTVTSAIGGENLPVYIDADGKPATCSQYAGGTAVTLNGAGKGGNDASFYAPTSVGTFGQILAADASGLPVWSNILDNKQDKISFTTNKGCVLVSDTNGNLATSNITSTELGYLDGVNANIQDALNGITSALGAATQGTINGNTYTGKLNGYTITYSTSPPTENNLNVITLVPR